MARRTSVQEVETPTGRRVDTVESDDRTYDRNAKMEDFIWFLLTIILAIVGVRFLLVLLGAQAGSGFVRFWYNLSQPFIAPFAGMFGTTDTYTAYGNSRFELESLVAMLIYALIAYLIILGIRLLRRDNERRI